MKKRALAMLLCLLLLPVSLPCVLAETPEQRIVLAGVAELDVPCAAAVLIDEDSGTVLYEKNATERRPIASITKVMTLLLTFEAMEEGRISREDMVPVSEHASSMGGSQIWL